MSLCVISAFVLIVGTGAPTIRHLVAFLRRALHLQVHEPTIILVHSFSTDLLTFLTLLRDLEGVRCVCKICVHSFAGITNHVRLDHTFLPAIPGPLANCNHH